MAAARAHCRRTESAALGLVPSATAAALYGDPDVWTLSLGDELGPEDAGVFVRVEGTAHSGIGLPTALTRRLIRAAMASHAIEYPGSAVRCGPPEGGTSRP
jgi:hypothetical protein